MRPSTDVAAELGISFASSLNQELRQEEDRQLGRLVKRDARGQRLAARRGVCILGDVLLQVDIVRTAVTVTDPGAP